MHNYLLTRAACLLLGLHFGIVGTADALDLFKTGFENGTMPAVRVPINADSVWTLPPVFENNYGPGNHFEVTDTTSHTGTYCLRFDYAARNGFCNTCGLYDATHKTGLDGMDFFVSDNGENLTAVDAFDKNNNVLANKGPAASPGKLVFNKDNGFSKWEVVKVENHNATKDKLALKLLKPPIDNQPPEFNSGDNVKIARQCGVDGNIGAVDTLINRSDCNSVITWFGKTNIEQNNQANGESIFRRVYLKQEISSPKIHQKLRYWQLPDGTNLILFGDSHTGNMQPQLSGINRLDPNAPSFYKPGLNLDSALEFERSEWYYIEEEFKAQSAPGVPDGEYRLWFAKSTDATGTMDPIIEETTLDMPPLYWTSLWGNIQHKVHTFGVWYIDDIYIKIGTTRIGPIAGGPTGTNISPPESPETTP